LKLHESFVCSIQKALVRMNEFERFVVFYGYLLVTARMAQSKHANNPIMGRDLKEASQLLCCTML